ncbi:hypothetical protein ACVW1C_007453 [Bradyrhizobium sp. USDA 4011]
MAMWWKLSSAHETDEKGGGAATRWCGASLQPARPCMCIEIASVSLATAINTI